MTVSVSRLNGVQRLPSQPSGGRANKAIPAVVMAFALLSLLSGCEREKTKLDREVDRLCAVDGGVRVYETVKLAPENFGPNGEVFPQYRDKSLGDGRLGPEYRMVFEERVLVHGNPMMKQAKISIVRNSDQKVLGTRTTYSRHGGDLPGPWQPSARSCLDVLKVPTSFEAQVFSRADSH